MKRLCDFGKDFETRVRQALPNDVGLDDLLVSDNGLVLYSRPHSNGYGILGCPTCVGMPHGQDSLGQPTVNGKTLLNYVDLASAAGLPIPPHLSGPATANLWLCPDCKMPVRVVQTQWQQP